MFEELSLGAADIGNFNDRTGMKLGIKITKAPKFAANLPFVSHFVAQRKRMVVEALIVARSISHVLQAFPARIQKFFIH